MCARHTDNFLMDSLILNCDLGEAEPPELTRQLLSLVDAANICCGVHAGSVEKTREAIKLAHEQGAMIGAHPGLSSVGGRGSELPSPDQFSQLLVEQIGSFLTEAEQVGARMSYVKLHGSLYHAVESDENLRRQYLDFIHLHELSPAVFCLAGGKTAIEAEALGIKVYHEAFADRAYMLDGSLMPRTQLGSVLTKNQAVARFETWRLQGYMPTEHDINLPLFADTLCVHGDSSDSLEMIKAIHERLP